MKVSRILLCALLAINMNISFAATSQQSSLSDDLSSLLSISSWDELIDAVKSLIAKYESRNQELEQELQKSQDLLEQQQEVNQTLVAAAAKGNKGRAPEEKPFELSQEQIDALNSMVGGDDLIVAEYAFKVFNMQSAKQLNIAGQVHNQVGMAADMNSWNIGVVALSNGSGNVQVSSCKQAAEKAVKGKGSIEVKVIDVKRSDVFKSHMDIYNSLVDAGEAPSDALVEKALATFEKNKHMMFNADEFDVSCEAIVDEPEAVVSSSQSSIDYSRCDPYHEKYQYYYQLYLEAPEGSPQKQSYYMAYTSANGMFLTCRSQVVSEYWHNYRLQQEQLQQEYTSGTYSVSSGSCGDIQGLTEDEYYVDQNGNCWIK